jgi:hypothetical protein
MNNYILITRTYCESTPESSEIGDFSDIGFIDDRQQVTFTQLVDLMINHNKPTASGNPAVKPTANMWYSTSWFTKCFRTGTDRKESIHFHHENTPNAAKYWRLARKYADSKLQVKQLIEAR